MRRAVERAPRGWESAAGLQTPRSEQAAGERSRACEGGPMSNRAWYIAIDGKQVGPYPEDQFRELIANGLVDRNSLVWSEGMTAWQRAGYVPGLFAPAQPPVAAPAPRRPGAFQPPGAVAPTYDGDAGPEDRLDAEFSALPLFGRALLYAIGMALV